MSDVLERGAEGEHFRDEDWYAEEIGAVRFVDCVFTDVDLTEASTHSAMFEGCTFHTCRLNASTHRASAFVGCDFRRCSFFTATLDGCKLTGSVFAECTLRPLKVVGGAWGSVTLRGAGLAGVERGEARRTARAAPDESRVAPRASGPRRSSSSRPRTPAHRHSARSTTAPCNSASITAA